MSRRLIIFFCLPLAAGILAVVLSGIRAVSPGEQLVVRRFGRLLRPAWGPGLHWKLPPGIDRAGRVRTDLVRQLTVGESDGSDGSLDPGAGEFLTGDLNLVRVQAIVQYRIARPEEAVIAAESVESLLKRVAEASLSRALARREIDAVIRGDRRRIAREVEADLANAAAGLQLGLHILGVNLTGARPPAEVAADFAAAQSAESQRDRRVTEANTRAATIRTEGTAEAQRVLQAARTVAHRKALTARAQADKFLAILNEVGRSRELTVRRVYLDAMKSLLGNVRRKIIVPPGDTLDLTVLGGDE